MRQPYLSDLAVSQSLAQHRRAGRMTAIATGVAMKIAFFKGFIVFPHTEIVDLSRALNKSLVLLQNLGKL
ncbi:hypothetical protein NIES1031_15665 [Chroogloeocystis siderophila 5.2 s.c.1]|uniref:Uncharacterized protein n=1 Tax=Chroogloeocystis siderophila 5.2 s.c.1 TaxID=247279 RepID=A0A1U7HMF7_9CHRO|nr:hypothetical protein NIES1031_15665 [Chroogloeocystis siderophila 5.2 s.c.1]